MPITIPEFVQYQGVLFPLRGLWNRAPLEGDKFVNAEVDWGSAGILGVGCVQFQLSGNSPVAFSQIVALSVDNSRCNADVDFLFPDSGFILTVPAFNQGIYPVFTNALMFYANSPAALSGDMTVLQILNSMPPPVAIQASAEQQQTSVTGIALSANATTQLVPVTVNGTLNAISITYTVNTTTAGVVNIALEDGTHFLWATVIDANAAPPTTNGSINLTGLHIIFNSGIKVVVSGSTLTSGTMAVNLYYSVP